MKDLDPSRARTVRRLFDLMRRVNASTDVDVVLEEVARGVVEVLGFGMASIARLEGDVLVMKAYAGPEEYRAQIVGRRTPKLRILDEFRQADRWGILRFVPHGRVEAEAYESSWIPDLEPSNEPDAWHRDDALYAPLYSATGDLLGNMTVDYPPGARIPDEELRDLLELFVVQAGLALSNAQQRERLAEQVRLGEIVTDVAIAASLVGLDSTLTSAARSLVQGFDAAQAWVRAFPDGEAGRLEYAAGYPRPSRVDGAVPGLRRDLGLEVWAGGGPELVTLSDVDVVTLPESLTGLQALMRAVGACSSLVAPLTVGAELLGYVVVMRTTDSPASEPETSAMREISHELGRIVLNARLYERESRLVSELQELDRYKGELIATISHELKTPLTSIMGHTELLDEAEHAPMSVRAIARNAERLDQLIANLLNYSRVQDKREHVRTPMDLEELCRDSLDRLELTAEVAGVTCSLSADRASGRVEALGDPDEVGRILDNVIGNALKYSRRGGRVDVHVRCRGEQVEVAVDDDGIGISTLDQAHLFSAFHRSSNPAAQSIPGTGLGLAISRRIAEMHGGALTAESELGVGSTFRLRLPRPRRLDTTA